LSPALALAVLADEFGAGREAVLARHPRMTRHFIAALFTAFPAPFTILPRFGTVSQVNFAHCVRAQLMTSVTPTPHQCSLIPPNAPRSNFSGIVIIIHQISTATGRLTWATSAAMAWNSPGARWPKAMPVTMDSATQTLR